MNCLIFIVTGMCCSDVAHWKTPPNVNIRDLVALHYVTKKDGPLMELNNFLIMAGVLLMLQSACERLNAVLQ